MFIFFGPIYSKVDNKAQHALGQTYAETGKSWPHEQVISLVSQSDQLLACCIWF